MLSFPSLAAPIQFALLNMEPTDPVIKPGAEAGEGRPRDPEERLEFMRRELEPECQTDMGRLPEELLAESMVREQPTEGPLHIPLAHHVLPGVLGRHRRLRRKRARPS
jgi:hypothetical protein